VRIDSQTGELFFFGYEADGDASTKVAYCVVDRHGSLVSEQWFDAPYCALMHDFAITENFVLFPIYPTTSDLARLRAGGDHWLHEMTRDSWVGVMPRYGSVSQMRWFRGPKGVFCYHMMNAFEDSAGRIQFDQCLSNANGLPFIRKASGLNLSQAELGSRLARWTIDLNNGSEEVSETVVGPPGDFPVIPAYAQGRPYTHAWMLTMNPQMQGPPVEGGPAGAMFNMLLRLDFAGGQTQAFELPPAHCINEPVLVPAKHAMDDGWLLAVVDQQFGPADFRHAVWIFEAGRIGAGPVARISIPHRLRPQVHGWWVSAAELASA
jgi:carotenoid cleavage dioxygenase